MSDFAGSRKGQMNRGWSIRLKLGPWLAAALALAPASASAAEVSGLDRFMLWNECRDVGLVVNDLPESVAAFGLDVDAIEVTARSRLRAARLYAEPRSVTGLSYLLVLVNAAGPAFNISLEYLKPVIDIVTMREGRARFWSTGETGLHGKNPQYLLSSVAELSDRFIDEYLRVNRDACEKRPPTR